MWLIVSTYLLRIVLMPITGQHDVMFMSWQANFVTQGHLNIYKYLYDRFGDVVMSRPAVWAPYPYGYYAFTSSWLKLIGGLGLIELVDWHLIWEVAHPARRVFLFKLAYLPFDVLIGYILYLSGQGSRGRMSWALWAWSSTAIYTPFMMGQNDIYATAFVTAGLYSAANSIRSSNRPSNRWGALAVLLLGIGATFKTFPLLLIPAVSLLLTGRWSRRLGWTFLGCLPFALAALPFLTTTTFLDGVLLNAEGMQLFQESSLFGFPVSLFLVSYIALLMYLSSCTGLTAPDRVWDVGLILLALLFIFVRTPLYWLIWITPLVVTAAARKGLWSFVVWSVLQLGFSVLLLTQHRELGVALPIHLSDEFNVPNLLTAVSLTHPVSHRGLAHMASLANSAILAALGTALWLAATALRRKEEPSQASCSLKMFPAIIAPVTVMFLGLGLNLAMAHNMVSPGERLRLDNRLSLSSETPTIVQALVPESTSVTGVRLRILDSTNPAAHLQVCLIEKDDPNNQQLACASKSVSQQVEDRLLYYLFDNTVSLEAEHSYAFRVHLETSDATVILPYSTDRSDERLQLGDTTMTGTLDISTLRPFRLRAALQTLVVRNIGGDLRLLLLMSVTGMTSVLAVAALCTRQMCLE
jgi:hypothetical protein